MVQRVRPTVIIQRYARRLLAILERNRLHFARVLARIRNLQGGPGSLREQRRQRRQQSVAFFTQWANRVEATGLTDAAMRRYYESAMPLPGNGALRWHTRMRNTGNARPSNPSYSLVHRAQLQRPFRFAQLPSLPDGSTPLDPSLWNVDHSMVRSDAVDAYTQDDVGPMDP